MISQIGQVEMSLKFQPLAFQRLSSVSIVRTDRIFPHFPKNVLANSHRVVEPASVSPMNMAQK
jgi:hypothetical protein